MVKKAKAFSQYYLQHHAFLSWLCTCTRLFLKEFCCVSPPSDKNIKLCKCENGIGRRTGEQMGMGWGQEQEQEWEQG